MTRVFEFGAFTLNSGARILTCNGESIQLTDKVFDILHVLARAGGEIVSKEQLVEQVWNGAPIGDSNISQHLLVARRALGDVHKPYRVIQTVHGSGYRMIPEVHLRLDAAREDVRRGFRRTAATQYVRAARHFAKMGSLPAMHSSNELCFCALEHASDCADALAQLAFNEIVQAACGYTGAERSFPSCKRYASQALLSDPVCHLARLALGLVQLFGGGCGGPLPESPSSAEGHVLRMLTALANGREDDAHEAARHARARHPHSVLVATYGAFVAYHTGAFGHAAAQLQHVLASRPDAAFARLLLGRALLALQHFSRARVHFETLLFPRAPHASRFEKFWGEAIAGLAYAAAREGDRHSAAALRDDLLRSHTRDYYGLALTAIALGDSAGASDALAHARQAQDPRTFFAAFDPLLRLAR